MKVLDNVMLEEPKFCIHNVKLMLVEGTDVSNVCKIRTVIKYSLLQKSETRLDRSM